jgi:hypothetical protein
MYVRMGDGLTSRGTGVDTEIEAGDAGTREHRDAFLAGLLGKCRPLAWIQFLNSLDMANGDDEDVARGDGMEILKGHGDGREPRFATQECLHLCTKRTPTLGLPHPPIIT